MNKFYIVLLSLLSLQASSQTLKLMPGTYLLNYGNITLDNASIVNDGKIVAGAPSSSFKMAGNAASGISGTGETSFGNLIMSKTGSVQLVLQKNISVQQAITMNGGNIDLRNTVLYLAGKLQNESENSRILSTGTGEIYTQYALNGNYDEEPGNLGLRLTGTQDLGMLRVRRLHRPQGNGTQQSIGRYFIVEPQNNTALNISLRFRYLDAELDGMGEAGLFLHSRQGQNNWTILGRDEANTNSNYVQKNGINALYAYTLFPAANAPLPLQLISFNVTCKEEKALLQWITANESGTRQFTAEKSTDGANWQAAAVIPAQGNMLQYSYSSTITPGGASYFRLKMEDMDGSFTYSPVRKMDCLGNDKILVGPNPTHGPLTISFQLAKKDNYRLEIFDARGSLVVSRTLAAPQGSSTAAVYLDHYAAGVYLVKLYGSNGNAAVHTVIKK